MLNYVFIASHGHYFIVFNIHSVGNAIAFVHGENSGINVSLLIIRLGVKVDIDCCNHNGKQQNYPGQGFGDGLEIAHGVLFIIVWSSNA